MKLKNNLVDKEYDYLIVGAGLFGAVCANKLKEAGYKICIIEKLNHIGGTCYSEIRDGIIIHKFGAHIFRTSDEVVWDFVNKFASFNSFINSPIALAKDGKTYNLPFNMNTFTKVWPEITTPQEAIKKIDDETAIYRNEPDINLEIHAKKMVGETLFNLLIKDYTEKQWGVACDKLPPEIMRRIPLRFTYDNNYYNDRFQGIPIGGYTKMIEKMIDGCDVFLETTFNYNDYKKLMDVNDKIKIIFTGPIDEFFNYKLGFLEYRGLKFEEKIFYNNTNYQGNAVINYTSHNVRFTRSIEHRFFDNTQSKNTIVSYEYPIKWEKGDYPFYPLNNKENDSLYNEYKRLADNENRLIFAGRLGSYKYYDMQDTIKAALELVSTLV